MKQTASQMWCLIRLLPFMIGGFIPEDDAKWEIFLTLRDIMEHILCPLITTAGTYELEGLIQQHHTLYLEVSRMPHPSFSYSYLYRDKCALKV